MEGAEVIDEGPRKIERIFNAVLSKNDDVSFIY
jgi:hypothetical protein